MTRAKTRTLVQTPSAQLLAPHFLLPWSAYLACYALEGLPNKILATEYRTVLPDEETIAEEIEKTRRQLEARKPMTPRRIKSRGA